MSKQTQRLPLLFAGLVAGLLLLITSQFLFNLKKVQLEHKGKTNTPRVALLLEGPTYDQGWNSSALESLNMLQKQYNFPLKISNNLNKDQIIPVAKNYAANGYDLVIGHGAIFSKPFTELAPYYPGTHFVSFNGEAVYPNTTTICYDMKPAGFIVGKLAAMMSKHNKVGYILVDKPAEYDQVEGFKKGVASVSPDTQVNVAVVSDFSDIPGAMRATRQLIAQGTDVIYTTGDSFNLAVITEAQKANIYAIGYISDQRYIAPNHVLSSLIQDVNQVYRTMFNQYFSGTFPSGKVMYGFAEGVNYLSPFGGMVPSSVREAIKQDLQRLMGRAGEE